MATLEPKLGFEFYLKRMKIEETYHEWKDLLHLTKLMNKKKSHLKQVIALSVLVYIVDMWFGVGFRNVVSGKICLSHVEDALQNNLPIDVNTYPKWLLYSIYFVFLKQKLHLPAKQLDAVFQAAVNAFPSHIYM